MELRLRGRLGRAALGCIQQPTADAYKYFFRRKAPKMRRTPEQERFQEPFNDSASSHGQDRLAASRPLVPKLPIGRITKSQFRELPRTRSQQLQLYEEEGVRQQARSLLIQDRLECIRFLSPKNTLGRPEESELHDLFPEAKTSRTRYAGEPQQNLYQQLKIKTIECEGLQTQIMLETAKHQTELLLKERRIKRLQLQLGDLQQQVCQTEQRTHLLIQTPASSERTLAQIPSSKSLRKFEKVELRSDDGSALQSPSSVMVDASQIDQRISKLQEMELQERKVAQSLFKIVEQIQRESDGSIRKNMAASPSRTPSKESQTQTEKHPQSQSSVGSGPDEPTNYEDASQKIAALESENSHLKKQLEQNSRYVEGLQEQFSTYQHNLSSSNESLSKANAQLENQRSKLALALVDKQLELQQLKVAMGELQSDQGSTQPYSMEEVPLVKQIEFLEYENFTLKGRIEQLSEICKTLESQLGEEKLSLERKICNLYSIVQKMEEVAIENEHERVRLEARLLELGELHQEEERRLAERSHSNILDCFAQGSAIAGNWKKEQANEQAVQRASASLPVLPLKETDSVLDLKVRIRQQEEEIEEMCGCINELEKDLLSKEKQLTQLRALKQTRQSETERWKEELEAGRVRLQELELRLMKQEELKVEELQQMFIREQTHLSRIAQLEIAVGNIQRDLVSSETYRQELQQTCEQFSHSLETLKDTNERLYNEATLLARQKNDLEQKLMRHVARRLERHNSNSQPIEENEDEEPSDREREYHRLTREVKVYVRQLGRLCDQLLNDLETRDVVAEMNKVNDHLQAKMIELNFSPEFKKSMWDSMEIRVDAKNDPDEETKMKEHVNFIEEFLEKTEDRNEFCQLIERKVDETIGKESELATIISKFLQNLYCFPSRTDLLERIDLLLVDFSGYEQHIDNKFRQLEKSIGQYLQQAHAVLEIEEEEDIKNEQCRSETQKRTTRPAIQGFCTEKRDPKRTEYDDLVQEEESPHERLYSPRPSEEHIADEQQPVEQQDLAKIAHSLKLEMLKQTHARIRQQRKKAIDEEQKQQERGTVSRKSTK